MLHVIIKSLVYFSEIYYLLNILFHSISKLLSNHYCCQVSLTKYISQLEKIYI